MDAPLISVIVPVYKVEKYLDRCVQSIVDQTYRNLEIILVDDGSPDNCPAICDAWAEKDNRIKVIHKENGGLSDARNAGMAITTGEYIAFVDSDDWVDRSFMETLLDLSVRTGADIAECNFIKTSGSTEARTTSDAVTVCTTEEALEKHIRIEMFKQVVWNKLYRKNVINVVFQKGKYHEDEFWTYQIIANCKKLAHIDRILYFYFQREDSIMGEGYSIKRIDAVEAKLQRNEFIKMYYPNLTCISDADVRFTLIYHGQLALRYVDYRERKQVFNKLKKMYQSSKPVDSKGLKITHLLWLRLADVNLLLCCKIRNLLGIGL